MLKLIILLSLFAACNLANTDIFDTPDTMLPLQHNQVDFSDNVISQAGKDWQNINGLRNQKTTSKNHKQEEVRFDLLEGSTSKCLDLVCLYFWKKCEITWMKIKAKDIMNEDRKILLELKDKLRYSYSVSPIKYNDSYNSYVMPLILFESLDEKFEVKSFKLTEHANLDFNNKRVLGGFMQGIPEVEKSTEEGYKNIYPYGILNSISPTGGDELISAFAALYNDGSWTPMKAEITIKHDNKETTYNILLSSKLFNEFMKAVIAKHPGLTTANTKFRIPVN
ncbi:S2/P23 family protein [Candidatus Borreliella tachyglossi]|uniref:S2/P23 family protein n=1 Tax=Candidatus Borreliella tachyglossi TaxID=1964448 RepID=UPI0040410D23